MPLSSMLDAAHFYMEQEGLMVLEEDQKVRPVLPSSCPSLRRFTWP